MGFFQKTEETGFYQSFPIYAPERSYSNGIAGNSYQHITPQREKARLFFDESVASRERQPRFQASRPSTRGPMKNEKRTTRAGNCGTRRNPRGATNN